MSEKHPVQEIAEKSPLTAGLVAALMERNYDEQVQIQERIRAGIEQERDEWRERALDAEARLRRIEDRIHGLLS